MQLWPERIQQLIERHPTFGYLRLWALLRFAQGIRLNRKAVYRVIGLQALAAQHLIEQRTTPAAALLGQLTQPQP